ncbi:Dor1-like protein [Aaosphaeria arxii CBS 175.79]|uniref:Conserved oligomeric Golgi complex subunit 8 n=1 Tax=Aaosphaeria arxii CBS 175.79 TaxID=1450172 RepID=A0A6A5XDZ9_9PLEO|nr:Dor1-like protein [Aaosphaeria arxii CBS 175.79]KAF2011037.1 Dor1-like protein [Aaosphaeria arxii CBS 175.79]
MADPLYELLVPYFDAQDTSTHNAPSPTDTATTAYLSRLTTLPLAALSSSEQQSLAQSSHSILRSLQSLSKRSYKPIIASSDHLSHLRDTLPQIGTNANAVHTELPKLESAARRFSDKYSKTSENPILERRAKAMLLARNIDRVSDVLDLPTLLSSAIASSTTPAQAASNNTTSATNANYASALDLYAHIKRLSTLYPESQLIASLSSQAEQEMKTMTSNLIAGLQSQSIKLAGAMRTIGWLRRVAPELDESWSSKKSTIGTGEGSLGALFLVCRYGCLEGILSALDPLKELADQETEQRLKSGNKSTGWGQQTERYLKRYIEIFREQSFAIISMYKDIFPSALPIPSTEDDPAPAVQPVNNAQANPLQPIPSALATFPLHLVELLFDTLRTYLPNIQDRSSRDSLLTQVLYCANSLGRRGGDFSMMIALLEEDLRAELGHDNDDEAEDEWIEVMKKHRVQASRLELLASGVGTSRTTSPAERAVSPAR